MKYALAGSYLHVKAYRDVLPKWASFSPKSLDKGPILVKKNSSKSVEGPISPKLCKKYRISCF